MKLNNNVCFVIAVVLFVLTSISISYMVVGIKDDKKVDTLKIEKEEDKMNYDINVSDLFTGFTNTSFKALYMYDVSNEKNLELYLKKFKEEYFVNNELNEELNKEIYNYQLKEIKIVGDTVEVIYYGLLKYRENEGLYLTNNSDLILSLNELDNSISEIDYLENVFEENKNKFMLFKYIFNLDNENYNINNFEILANIEK